MNRASLLAIASVVAILAACGKRPEVHVEKGPGGASTVTVQGPAGQTAQVTTGGAASQVKLPAYLPLYPGAVVESSMTSNSPAGGGNVLMFHTSAKPSQVIDFYKQKAGAAGFGSTFSNQAGENMMFTAGREGSEDNLAVVATPGNGGSSVQLTWSEGPRG